MLEKLYRPPGLDVSIACLRLEADASVAKLGICDWRTTLQQTRLCLQFNYALRMHAHRSSRHFYNFDNVGCFFSYDCDIFVY